MSLRVFKTISVGLIVLLWCSTSNARLDYNVSRAVVLYDASRSMYPGYTLGAPANPRPPYFHEHAEFVEWLLRLLASQGERFGARTVELDAFYNVGRHPNVRIDTLYRSDSPGELGKLATTRSGIEKGLEFFRPIANVHQNPEAGQHTYLLEAVKEILSGWDGIIWLITDNIVEEAPNGYGHDSPDVNDLNGFFFHLRDDPRYRSVHVYSYPYEMDGRKGALAVYGLLVSPDKPESAVLESLDSRFFDMTDVFPGGKHLKLRDLNVSPLEFSPVFTVRLMNQNDYFSSEGHRLEIDHSATVASNLTQHTVVSGAYEVFADELRPTEEAVSAYGVAPLPSDLLTESKGNLPVLVPEGSVTITGSLSGREAIRLKGMGLLSKIRWALAGDPIKYESDIHILFSNLKLNFEPQRLDEVYGMSRALAVFGINSGITTLDDQKVTRHISLSVSPPAAIGWLLLALLLVALGVIGLVLWLLLRKSNYRVTKAGEATVVPLRPLGNHDVRHEGLLLGHLRRRLSRDFVFLPHRAAGLQVEEQGDPASWRATLQSSGEDRRVLTLKFEGLQGGKARRATSISGPKTGSGPGPVSGGRRPGSPPPPKQGPPSPR